MKNLKIKLALVLLAMTVLLLSCNEQEPLIIDPDAGLVEVSFDINQFIPQTAAKDDNKDGSNIPECVDNAEPTHVVLNIGQDTYTLNIVNLPGKMETEVIKLIPGDYSVTSFIVYDDTTPIYASPLAGSYYEQLWNIGMPVKFTVTEFQKLKVDVDVLCYQPYDYADFGFAWFEYAKYEVRTVCFFGDICSKFWEDFNASSYYPNDLPGYEFVGRFSIEITTPTGTVVGTGANYEITNAGVTFTEGPICIEYPDQLSTNDAFIATISMLLPDGSPLVIGSVDVLDTDFSEINGDSSWGDTANQIANGTEDGVFDFVVGNCSYDGNNANFEFPAWVPTPSGEVSFKISQTGGTEEGYVRAIFDLGGNDYADLKHGVEIAMWCAEKGATINYNKDYTAKVYSSLQLLSTLPTSAQNIPWGKLNWIMNHKDGFTNAQVQGALWYLIHGAGTPGALAVTGLTDVAVANWQPGVGDWAILIVDADGFHSQGEVQLMIVRVDP